MASGRVFARGNNGELIYGLIRSRADDCSRRVARPFHVADMQTNPVKLAYRPIDFPPAFSASARALIIKSMTG